MAFLTGAVVGAAAGRWSAYKYSTATPTVLTKSQTIKAGVTGGAQIAARAGWAVAKAEHVPGRALGRVKQEAVELYHVQQTKFQALSDTIGPSGFVGTLHQELLRNQSFVNYG